MKIKELIQSVAKLVETREIIDHGSIRCLHSDQVVRDIEGAEGCDEVGTGEIGDDDLASELFDLSEDGDQIAELYFEDLKNLEDAYLGDSVDDYIDRDKEDELKRLYALIEVARELV